MRKTQNKYIGESDWVVTQFPAGEGIRLLARLTQLVGPALAGLAGSAGDIKKPSDILDMDLSAELLTNIAKELVLKLDEDTTLSLIKRLLACTRKDGEEVIRTFDVTFQGEYATMFKVIAFVLKVNYASFLKESDEQGSSEQQTNP